MNTKNISLLGLGLFAAVALASCDHVEESLSKPITNPQEPMFSSESVVYKAYPYIDASNPEAGDVQIAYCTSKDELPAGFYFLGTLELSPYEDFSEIISVPLTSEGNTLYVNVGDIASQYTDNFTKNPATTRLYGRTSLSITDGSETVHIGGLDKYFGVETYTFTPVPADKVIASSYVIVQGNGETWDYLHTVAFNHSDKNQYDDPNFTTVVKNGSAVENGDKWFIISLVDLWKVKGGEKTLADCECLVPVYDYTKDGVAYGDLEVLTSGVFNATAMPSIEVPCEIAFNARNMTYTSKAALERYYATGNGWSGWGAHWMPLFTADYTDYKGFLNLDGEFKFSPQEGWGGDFGSSVALAETEKDGVYSYDGTLDRASDNIKTVHAGLYFATLSINNWKLTLQQTKTWGLIGDFNGWGADVTMTPSEDLYTWTAELTVSAGQGWKFRANGGWDFNLGGTADNLVTNGDNIVLPEAGTYTITLDLTTYPATFKAEKK